MLDYHHVCGLSMGELRLDLHHDCFHDPLQLLRRVRRARHGVSAIECGPVDRRRVRQPNARVRPSARLWRVRPSQGAKVVAIRSNLRRSKLLLQSRATRSKSCCGKHCPAAACSRRHTYMYNVRVNIHAHAHACPRLLMESYAHIHTRMHTCRHVRTYACTRTCTHACILHALMLENVNWSLFRPGDVLKSSGHAQFRITKIEHKMAS